MHGSQHRRTGRLCALTAGSPSGSAAPMRRSRSKTSTEYKYCRVSKNFKFVLVLVCQLCVMAAAPRSPRHNTVDRRDDGSISVVSQVVEMAWPHSSVRAAET